MMRNGIPGHHALGLEPLLQKHKVDMYIAAHMHSYERFLPVYNGSSSARCRPCTAPSLYRLHARSARLVVVQA